MIVKIIYRCLDCGHVFEDDEAIVHWGTIMRFSADMDACPKCDSENLEEEEIK